LGDAFPGPANVGALAPDEAARLFGESELARELFLAPVSHWSGPFRSGYGWHLIFVTSRTAPLTPAIGEIRDRIAADYAADVRAQRNAEAFERLKRKYRIEWEGAPDG
jgi:parvulin-like peptidyl-prolyl isomerase